MDYQETQNLRIIAISNHILILLLSFYYLEKSTGGCFFKKLICLFVSFETSLGFDPTLCLVINLEDSKII